MTSYLHENPDEMRQLVTDAATYFGRAEAYIKKDYFAMAMLGEIVARNPRVVFKGGTCLSKCYQVIDRFSEDVDLGMSEEHVTEGMRKSLKRAVVEAADALGLTIENVDKTRSRREYNRYDIAVPGNREGDILIVETAVMTPTVPTVRRSVQSFIGEYCDAIGLDAITDEYGLGPFEVNANSIERTFCDKVFALCDYYLADEPIPTRQSRHMYDLRKLQERISFDDELAALFVTVRRQRLGKHRCPSASPDVDLAAVLRTLVDTSAYKRDYLNVTSDLLYETMPYDEAAQALCDIADFVSGIDWSSLTEQVDTER